MCHLRILCFGDTGLALSTQVLGSIDGSGRIRLVDPQAPPDAPTPVDLELETVLGSMPNKTFRFSRTPLQSQPLILPEVIEMLWLCHAINRGLWPDCMHLVEPRG